MRVGVCIPHVLALTVVAGGARALEEPHEPSLIDRPHTIAELEAGAIAIPTAPISKATRGGDTPFLKGVFGKGDATIQTGIHLLYRGGRDWALGAGALFAPSPTSDSNAGGLGILPRTHSRSYLWIGTEGRYVPLHLRTVEGWVGL